MVAAFVVMGGVEGEGEGGEEGEEVGGCGEEEGGGGGVAEGTDYGGEEVWGGFSTWVWWGWGVRTVEGLGGDEGHLLECEEVEFGVEEGLLEAPEDAVGVSVGDAGVFLADAVFGEGLVGGGDEAVSALEGVVGEEGHGEEGDGDGHGAFDDEEPFLGIVSPRIALNYRWERGLPKMVSRPCLPSVT